MVALDRTLLENPVLTVLSVSLHEASSTSSSDISSSGLYDLGGGGCVEIVRCDNRLDFLFHLLALEAIISLQSCSTLSRLELAMVPDCFGKSLKVHVSHLLKYHVRYLRRMPGGSGRIHLTKREVQERSKLRVVPVLPGLSIPLN